MSGFHPGLLNARNAPIRTYTFLTQVTQATQQPTWKDRSGTRVYFLGKRRKLQPIEIELSSFHCYDYKIHAQRIRVIVGFVV